MRRQARVESVIFRRLAIKCDQCIFWIRGAKQHRLDAIAFPLGKSAGYLGLALSISARIAITAPMGSSAFGVDVVGEELYPKIGTPIAKRLPDVGPPTKIGRKLERPQAV